MSASQSGEVCRLMARMTPAAAKLASSRRPGGPDPRAITAPAHHSAAPAVISRPLASTIPVMYRSVGVNAKAKPTNGNQPSRSLRRLTTADASSAADRSAVASRMRYTPRSGGAGFAIAPITA